VLSPVSSETAVARQQQLNIIVVAILASLAVAGIGLLTGQNISRPILRAVGYLRGNTEVLNTLANRQQDAASSQMWVVDSSQIGLRSVHYYTNATKLASDQLLEMMKALVQSWQYLDTPSRMRQIEHIGNLASYMSSSVNYQESSNRKLEAALKVATEVTEQLNEGARSASESAEVLERTVEELRAVIGQ
jgi:hypothetical protein